MWLDGISARVATEVRELLSNHEPSMGEPDRHRALWELLQYLSVQLTGRDLKLAEFESVWHGGAANFEQLMRQYQHERLHGHNTRGYAARSSSSGA